MARVMAKMRMRMRMRRGDGMVDEVVELSKNYNTTGTLGLGL